MDGGDDGGNNSDDGIVVMMVVIMMVVMTVMMVVLMDGGDDGGDDSRAANYCPTSDNVRLNLANVRAKVILIGHWSDHKKLKLSHYTSFCCDKIRLQIHSICILQ